MKRILAYFLIWKTCIYILLFFSIAILPLQFDFLGGGLFNYLIKPYFWAFANFDGEHYLNIAKNGYGFLEHAFFPLYPFSMRFIGNLFAGTLEDFALAGLLISNVSFIIALIGLYKLVRIDHPKKIANLTLLLLFLYPTSFYFGSVYTESTFLAFVVWSFYYARKKDYIKSGILGFFASATRFLGVVLLPVLFIEYLKERKNIKLKKTMALLLIPVGLVIFMYYLYVIEGDPLKFIKVLPGYGEQRQITPVILPQVFYRYIFKILPEINYNYFPIVFTTLLEVITAIVFLILTILLFIKDRLSYAVYTLSLYIVPTLTGSFSSLPRYVLVLFPAFIIAAVYISKLKKPLQLFIYILLLILSSVTAALFFRGFWIS